MFEYLDFLQTPNPTFNNMPICPFIAGDLQTGNIKFMVYNSEMDTSLIEMIQEWEQSDFKTGLILHVGDDMKTTKRKPYQKFLNEQIKEHNMKHIKLLVFSPFEDFNIGGIDTRKKEFFTKPSEIKRHKRNLSKLRNKYAIEKEKANKNY